MAIADDVVVSMHYVLTSSTGEVLDSSDSGPLSYLHGHSNIIPGLERELAGKTVGEKLEVVIQPDEAYGARHEELVQTIPREAFEGVDRIEAGMQFHAQTPEGGQLVTITKVEGDQITIDGNHPLAGEVLHFQVEITDVREATEEEKAHGHVHGPGGHAH